MKIHAIASDDSCNVFVVHDDGSIHHYDLYYDHDRLIQYLDIVIEDTILSFAHDYDDAYILVTERDYPAPPPLRLLTPSWLLDVHDNLASRLIIAALYLPATSHQQARTALHMAKEARYLDDRWLTKRLIEQAHISTLINILTK